MATQTPTFCITRTANADLSAKQYYFVEAIAGGKADACNAITDVALGVLQNDPTSGLPAAIAVLGTSKVVAGAAIAECARVAPMASGKAQTSAITQYARGIALEAAAADGDIIEILLITTTVQA